MGDFNSDTQMVDWGRKFCRDVYRLCDDKEVCKFGPPDLGEEEAGGEQLDF
jgi:hypothetical protein